MKRIFIGLVILMLLASCASIQSVRKCDGRLGTRVPMGVL